MKKIKGNKNVTAICFAYATMWVAVAAAVISGMLITKSAWCLWAFLLPAQLKFDFSSGSESDDNDYDSKRLDDDFKVN